MKNWQKGLSLVCAGVMSVSLLAGCKGKDKSSASADPTVLNVETMKVSYGVTWLTKIAEKFEAVYADQGYKVNILKPSSDMRGGVAIQQLARGYDATKVDLYVSGGVTSSSVGQEGSYYSSAGVLCEEISDLWDAKPIGFDGKEESVTLREKVAARAIQESKDSYGKVYTLPYMASTGGMVVNKRKLALYGINTLPTTTNELFDMWTTIYTGANDMGNSEETKIFPFTYMPGSENGYTIDWFLACMAQYDEKQSDEYWSWQTENADGSVTWWEDGVTAAANDAMLASLEVMAQAFDTYAACYGTETQTLDQAQAQIMKQNEGAVFMCNGSWYLNDMALSYASSLEDITFINFPVVSKLANKIWGDTVTDATKLENMLRKAIACVDDANQVNNPQAIATAMTTEFHVEVTKEDIEEVRRARFAFSDRTGQGIFITKGSPKVDIAKLFIRMIASEDAAKSTSEAANNTSAYLIGENTYSQYTFVKDASKIYSNPYATPHSNQARGYRFAMGRIGNSMFNGHIPAYIAGLKGSESIYDGNGGMSGKSVDVYKDLAADILSKEYNALANGYASWKATNADRIAFYNALPGYKTVK